MKHFINIKDIPSKDLKKIILDAKKRKAKRKNSSTLDPDKDKPLNGKLLIIDLTVTNHEFNNLYIFKKIYGY